MTKPPPAPFSLHATRIALAEYDATFEARAIKHNADTTAWDAAEKSARDAVREAFAKDTADRNTREQAMQAQLSWIREWVAAAPPPAVVDLTPHAGRTAILLTTPGDLALAFRGERPYMAPTEHEITGQTADQLGVAGLVVECWMPSPSLAEMAVWDDGEGDAPTPPAPPPPAPIVYRVKDAWYDDSGPDMGPGDLAQWVSAWERDLASVIHDHLTDAALQAAEQRAEMRAAG